MVNLNTLGDPQDQSHKDGGMSERWLRCWIYKGMFSDELAIKYAPRGRDSFSAFVPRQTVVGKEDNEGKVKVLIFHEGPTAWAVLPSATQVSIPVDEEDIFAVA